MSFKHPRNSCPLIWCSVKLFEKTNRIEIHRRKNTNKQIYQSKKKFRKKQSRKNELPDSYLNSCLAQPRSLCQVFPGVAAIKTNIFIGNLSQFLMRRPRASQSPLSFFNPPKSGKVFFYQILIGPPIPPPKKTETKKIPLFLLST